MKVRREFDIWLLAMYMRIKKETYKKLKSLMRHERFTPEEFMAYCDQEIEHIQDKYMKAVKDL